MALKRLCITDDSLVCNKKSKISASETKLTNLNCDCLYSIFKFLDLNEALKMCRESDIFVEPANILFRRMYKTQSFTFDEYNHDPIPTSNDEKAFYCFQSDWYKYFGQSVSKLLIRSFIDDRRYTESRILEHCSELKELTIQHYNHNAFFQHIDNSFDKLEVLRLNKCFLTPTFCRFNEWFPNLRTLEVRNCEIDDESCIKHMVTTMHSLESLHLGERKRISKIKYNVDGVIKANKHVKNLGLNFGCTPRDVRLVQKEMKQLVTLQLWIKVKYFKRTKPINFRTVRKLVVNIDEKERFSDIPCPMVFEVLEELEITSNYFEEQWLFFAKSNELKKLKLVTSPPNKKQLLDISTYWPSLIEVTISVQLSAELIEFIESLPNLQRFNFQKPCEGYGYTVMSKYREVIVKLPPEFKVVEGDNYETYSLIRQN